jgi:hypothetical protein
MRWAVGSVFQPRRLLLNSGLAWLFLLVEKEKRRAISPGALIEEICERRSAMVLDEKVDRRRLRIDEADSLLSREVLVALQLRNLLHDRLRKHANLDVAGNIVISAEEFVWACGRDALEKISDGREARVAGSLIVKRAATDKIQLWAVVGIVVNLAVVVVSREAR